MRVPLYYNVCTNNIFNSADCTLYSAKANLRSDMHHCSNVLCGK